MNLILNANIEIKFESEILTLKNLKNMVSLRPAIGNIIEETVHGLVDAECTIRENTYCCIHGPIIIDITLSGVCEEGIFSSSTMDELANNKITIKGIAIDIEPGASMYKTNCWMHGGEKKN